MVAVAVTLLVAAVSQAPAGSADTGVAELRRLEDVWNRAHLEGDGAAGVCLPSFLRRPVQQVEPAAPQFSGSHREPG